MRGRCHFYAVIGSSCERLLAPLSPQARGALGLRPRKEAPRQLPKVYPRPAQGWQRRCPAPGSVTPPGPPPHRKSPTHVDDAAGGPRGAGRRHGDDALGGRPGLLGEGRGGHGTENRTCQRRPSRGSRQSRGHRGRLPAVTFVVRVKDSYSNRQLNGQPETIRQTEVRLQASRAGSAAESELSRRREDQLQGDRSRRGSERRGKAASDPEPCRSGTFSAQIMGTWGSACQQRLCCQTWGDGPLNLKTSLSPASQLRPEAPDSAPRLSQPWQPLRSRVGSRTPARSQRQPPEVTAGHAHAEPSSRPGASVTCGTCPRAPTAVRNPSCPPPPRAQLLLPPRRRHRTSVSSAPHGGLPRVRVDAPSPAPARSPRLRPSDLQGVTWPLPSPGPAWPCPAQPH